LSERLCFQTEHLKIYPYHQKDFNEFFLLLTNPMVNSSLDIPEFSTDFQRVRDFLSQISQKTNPDYTWLLYSIYKKKDNRLIGGCGFKVDLKHMTAEIFFMLFPREWGKGFMVEAALPLLNNIIQLFCLENIYALILPNNIRAKAVMRKLGFEYYRTINCIRFGQKRSVQKWILRAR